MSGIMMPCRRCNGTGWDHSLTCVVCDATGRVPAAEATLRAEVARLTEERDKWKACAQREPSDKPGIMDELAKLYYLAAAEPTMNGLLWMLAADCAIQGSYWRFYCENPERERGVHNRANAGAAASMLISAASVLIEYDAALVRLMKERDDWRTNYIRQVSVTEEYSAEVARLTATLAERDGEIERLVGREQEAAALLGQSAPGARCPSCAYAPCFGLPGHAPGCARAAWLAGCKS